jgi:hypothetical protein
MITLMAMIVDIEYCNWNGALKKLNQLKGKPYHIDKQYDNIIHEILGL